MIFALDTNIISFLLRPNKNPDVVETFEHVVSHHEYVIPPMCYYEISWHLKWKKAHAQERVFATIAENSVSTYQMTEADFAVAADIKALLMEQGTPIGKQDGDIFIAAHCIVNDYVLVTDNTNDFKRIDGLKFVNWKT